MSLRWEVRARSPILFFHEYCMTASAAVDGPEMNVFYPCASNVPRRVVLLLLLRRRLPIRLSHVARKLEGLDRLRSNVSITYVHSCVA